MANDSSDLAGARSRRPRGIAGTILGRIVLALLVVGASGAPAQTLDERWSFELGALFTDAYGHDQHVLTIHEIAAGSQVVSESGVTLDTGATTGYHGEFQYARDVWGLGIDFFFITLGQKASRGAAADGSGASVVFEVADASFMSTGPGEVLYFDVLEDTDINAWTLDFYGTRALAGSGERGIDFRFGLRIADFDNDYRAVVGIENVGGRRLDASSNYGAMLGPLVGVTGRFERGRNTFEGYVGQSVVLGEAELSNMRREFSGPFVAEPDYTSEESFHAMYDIAIPMTDVRLEWHYRLSRMISLGLGAHASAWWDVSVPPGVIPVEGGDDVLHENTIVFYGLAALVELDF